MCLERKGEEMRQNGKDQMAYQMQESMVRQMEGQWLPLLRDSVPEEQNRSVGRKDAFS